MAEWDSEQKPTSGNPLDGSKEDPTVNPYAKSKKPSQLATALANIAFYGSAAAAALGIARVGTTRNPEQPVQDVQRIVREIKDRVTPEEPAVDQYTKIFGESFNNLASFPDTKLENLPEGQEGYEFTHGRHYKLIKDGDKSLLKVRRQSDYLVYVLENNQLIYTNEDIPAYEKKLEPIVSPTPKVYLTAVPPPFPTTVPHPAEFQPAPPEIASKDDVLYIAKEVKRDEIEFSAEHINQLAIQQQREAELQASHEATADFINLYNGVFSDLKNSGNKIELGENIEGYSFNLGDSRISLIKSNESNQNYLIIEDQQVLFKLLIKNGGISWQVENHTNDTANKPKTFLTPIAHDGNVQDPARIREIQKEFESIIVQWKLPSTDEAPQVKLPTENLAAPLPEFTNETSSTHVVPPQKVPDLAPSDIGPDLSATPPPFPTPSIHLPTEVPTQELNQISPSINPENQNQG